MNSDYNEYVGQITATAIGDIDEAPEFIQNIFGSLGIDKKEKDRFIKKYLGIKSSGDSIRTYKRYPRTFYKAISLAIEDLLGRAKNIEKTESEQSYGGPISYSLDEGESISEDAMFGGIFDINGKTIRAVIESATPKQSGIIIMGPQGTSGGNYISFSVYTRKEDRRHVLSIFDIVNQYVEDKNPLEGKIINIYGEEEHFGNYDWNDIAIPDYFKQEVEENVIWHVKYHDKIEAANLRVQRGLMLEGERGMGKTLLSKIVANKIKGDGNFIKAKPSDIHRLGWNYVFEISKTLTKSGKTSVLYIEDIETLAPSKHMFGIMQQSLTDLLDYLDGTENRGNVIILTSTNVPESVELSLIDRPGRIDRRLVFDPKNKDFGLAWKKEVFEIHLRGHKLDERLSTDKLANMIADKPYTGSHIEELIHTATLEALRRMGIKDMKLEQIKDKIYLTEQDFKNAIKRVERLIKVQGPEIG